MASWIVHLRVAEQLLAVLSELDEVAFTLGNVAPDSGIPDEKWENFDPPPWVTHFELNRGLNFRCADLDFYRSWLAGLPPAGVDNARTSYLWGYFIHLVTDNAWYQQVGQPTKARFASQFDADPDFIWEVKKDWYGLDHIYVRDHPLSLFWRVFLHAPYPPGYLDFLPAQAIHRQIDYIRQYYTRADEDVQAAYARKYIYLTQSEMDDFVTATGLTCEHIFKALRGKLAAPDGLVSALELV